MSVQIRSDASTLYPNSERLNYEVLAADYLIDYQMVIKLQNSN